MPRKSYSTAPKKEKRLLWRVEYIPHLSGMAAGEGLFQTLQRITDEDVNGVHWRVHQHMVMPDGSMLVSAYLSSWGAKADDDASDDAT